MSSPNSRRTLQWFEVGQDLPDINESPEVKQGEKAAQELATARVGNLQNGVVKNLNGAVPLDEDDEMAEIALLHAVAKKLGHDDIRMPG
jgi:hypothetical protein